MKRSFFIAVLVLLAQAFCFAGGDVVNNGGGASELILVYAYQNYDSLVENCWRTPSCELDSDESKLLQEIMESLPQERNVALKFVAKKELGDKLFTTSSQIGSQIEINKDQLWKTGLTGEVEAYTLSDAIELLSMAWGQHHSTFDAVTSNSLSQKLALRALHGRTTYLPYFNSSNMRLLTLKNRPMDTMLLDDGYDAFVDLNPLLLQQLPCKPEELSIYTFQWSYKMFPDTDSIRVLANGRIGWRCSSDSPAKSYLASLAIVLKTRPVSGSIPEFLQERHGNLKILAPVTPEVILSNIEEKLALRAL